jgi:hypothetical protein
LLVQGEAAAETCSARERRGDMTARSCASDSIADRSSRLCVLLPLRDI